MLQLEESTELARGPWKLAGSALTSGELELEFNGAVHVGGQQFHLAARKQFSIESTDNGWTVSCGLELFAGGHHRERWSVGTELVFKLLASYGRAA
jgi:hypothetical protein